VTRASPSWKLAAFVLGVDIAALAALATLPTAGLTEKAGIAAFMVVLAAVAGARPVRMTGLRLEMTPTHPLILIGLALQGPMTAAAVGLGGVIGAACGRRRRSAPLRLPFNLGAVALSVSAAAWVFLAMGGRPGAALLDLLWPLAGATTLYFVMNSGLVSAAIAMERRQPLFRTWRVSFRWTIASYFAGLTLAALLLLVFQALGPWGLTLAIPPCWLLVSFYREHKKRVHEKQQRVDEVEALNANLDRTVNELREALAHVKQLQGLIPICMHCKSIRDDKDTWHRLEEYLADHSDAAFTHSLCVECREKHYQVAVKTP
jgi:hypothetical protein